MSKILILCTIGLLLMIGATVPAPSSAAKQKPLASPLTRDDFQKRRTEDQFVRSQATIDTFESLIAKAQAEGSVDVIVGLRINSFQPEGKLLGPSEVAIQRQAIAHAQDVLMERLSKFNLRSIKKFQFMPFMAMAVDLQALKELKNSPDVFHIQEDLPVPPLLAQSVSLIGAPAAWAAGFSGAGQTIAILDSGVDKTHGFLAGKVVSEACYSSGGSSFCPGGVASSTSPGSGVNCSNFIEGCYHGTHVAGIAAGKGTSFSGVAKDANIIAIQVFSRVDDFNECKGPTPCIRSKPSDQLLALERVFALRTTFNIAAVNMSLGGGKSPNICDSIDLAYTHAIDNLRSVGIATVIASGNEAYKDGLAFPACISLAISVGATGDGSGFTPVNQIWNEFEGGSLVRGSNSANFLSLLAPGELICSSVPSGLSNVSFCPQGSGGDFANLRGTSMAAPHVAGAWAVLKSKKPTATVDEVFAALRNTGVPVTDLNGITKPRIKLDAAINAISGGNNCATTPIAIGQSLNGSLTTTDCRYPTGSNWFSDAYSFNGIAGQQIAISMSSASFDTWIILVGPTGSELTFDNDGGGGTNSRIPGGIGFFTLPATGTFVIQATSNAVNATGPYTLSLSAPPVGVSNNNFANAQIISGSAGSVTGNNTGATIEFGEPFHAGNVGGSSVWYRWQAPASASVTFVTAGSSFDTLLAVYTGSSVGALTSIVSNDDVSFSDLSSRVTFNAVAGTTYFIAVDGFNGATGSITLSWASGPAGPANNNFASAQIISGNSGATTGNNANATKEPGEPNHAGDSGGVSVWYQWQAPSSGSATITTTGSNFDTLLAVYTGSAVSSLVPVTSNDDESYPTVLSSRVTFNAVAGTTYRIAVDGYSGASGSIVLNFAVQSGTTIQLSLASFSVVEGSGSATITVARFGNVAGSSNVNFTTSDTAGLQSCTTANGRASERCDYVTSLGTVRFAAGEIFKTFTIPIIDDVRLEGNESFTVSLNGATGATLVSPATATVTIVDNDFLIPLSNPIDGVDFFIRQQYLDILNRQPDTTGLQNWINTLAPCPNGGFGEPPTSNCDRLHVAAGFFQSDEFLNRGYWAFRFYMVSHNQRPTYAQFIPDMAQVGGPKSPAEEEASKVAFADAFVQRPAFIARYGSLTGQALANALLQTAGLPSSTFTVTGNMTNGRILRGIVETAAVSNRFLTEGTVSIQYFGFLRRDPDTIGYQNNVNTLNANPNNLRHMIFIFIYSTEYRSRFGP